MLFEAFPKLITPTSTSCYFVIPSPTQQPPHEYSIKTFTLHMAEWNALFGTHSRISLHSLFAWPSGTRSLAPSRISELSLRENKRGTENSFHSLAIRHGVCILNRVASKENPWSLAKNIHCRARAWVSLGDLAGGFSCNVVQSVHERTPPPKCRRGLLY
ncbi:hypothetical protein CEXT_443591 [Caerostris extrusa]|uniref:Uncharacterized protein n=1 Tax=Caerostris extrusa TaxID=172846 RepID=A0AAV4SAU4_CAEEX|nr:hypothetical protein CEXT_443591 [Caerostris extrusa]